MREAELSHLDAVPIGSRVVLPILSTRVILLATVLWTSIGIPEPLPLVRSANCKRNAITK